MEKYEKVYNENWKELVENEDGTLNKDAVMRELADYHILLKEVPDVYEEFTGLTKPHTRASHIISEINARMIDREVALEDLLQFKDDTNGEYVIISVNDLKEYLRTN